MVLFILKISKNKNKRVNKRIYVALISYTAAVTIAEIVTVYHSKTGGMGIHAILLLFLILHSSLERKKDFSNLLKVLTLVPLIRLLSISTPSVVIQPMYQYFIISIVLVLAVLLLIKHVGIRKEEVGFRWGDPRVQLMVALTGVLFGWIEYGILEPQLMIENLTTKALFVYGIVLIVYTGTSEELIFRGMILSNAERMFGRGAGLIFVSVLFTSMHTIHQSMVDLAFVFGVGLFYGYVFLKTRSIFGVSLSHGITNVMLLLILPSM